MTRRAHARLRRHRQVGAALIVGVLLFALIGISALIVIARGSDDQAEKDRRTAEALAQAKAALIGYAVGDVLTTGNRFGDLPCPDTDGDGTASIAATGLPEVCDTQDKRLGRLPWKTLGLPDLRDGDGERLWYAVSINFKNNTRTSCSAPTDPGCLNSDSRGTITVRDSAGEIHNDGANPNEWLPSGAIAVIISPGAPLTRQGAGAVQDRSSGGTLNAINYLDVALGEDNANFIDGGANGFINGPVSVDGGIIVNDRIAVIGHGDLMPVLERRVAREVGRCLDEYALANAGRYPWAAEITASGASGNFSDVAGNRVGRVPDEPFEATCSSSVGTSCSSSLPVPPPTPMALTWGGACNLSSAMSWWKNWKLHVFYSVADAYKPGSTAVPVACGSCLTLNSPSGPLPGVRYVVTVSGKRLRLPSPGIDQRRDGPADFANPQNYLEGENVFVMTTPDVFETQPSTATFNDMLIYK